MRIPCPFCGDRELDEFTYLGDASVQRPDRELPDADGVLRLRLSARQSGRAASRILVSRRRLPRLARGRRATRARTRSADAQPLARRGGADEPLSRIVSPPAA